jgi:glycerol-3-phosphate cytidylyltransferase-like family protein
MGAVFVTGAFDDLGLRHVRLLHECSRIGEVVVGLWSDAAACAATGTPPKFRLAERRYLLESLRFVSRVVLNENHREPQGPREAGAPTVYAEGCDLGAPATELAAACRRRRASRRAARIRGQRPRRVSGNPRLFS